MNICLECGVRHRPSGAKTCVDCAKVCAVCAERPRNHQSGCCDQCEIVLAQDEAEIEANNLLQELLEDQNIARPLRDAIEHELHQRMR